MAIVNPIPARRRPPAQRGTAIFVVVLVITLLTGIGMFAARVTGSVNAATGNARQSSQARALALYAAQLAPTTLTALGGNIQQQMDTARAAPITQCLTNRFLPQLECAIVRHRDLEAMVARSGATFGMLTPQAADAHGSLGASTGMTGIAGIEGNMLLEYFERGPAPQGNGERLDGNDPDPTPPLEYAITASAQIRPIIAAANTEWCSPDNSSATANVQAMRMYVTVP